jgi:asparagine synthase (glutamine-hydrolysing)
VLKLLPATVLQVDLASAELTEQSYYQLRAENIDRVSDGDLAGMLRERLDASIARHLVADVPMGVFLSGGLDSSAITCFANRHHPRPLATFSMGFAASMSAGGDELEAAATVAKTLGNPNTQFYLAPNALDDLFEIAGSLEEPLSDSAALPLWHLCKGTSACVKVALSGEGGDETLGGYARYFWAGVAEQLSRSAIDWRRALTQISETMPTRTTGLLNLIRRAGKLAHSIDFPESLRYLSWFEIFTPAEQRALCGREASRPAARVEALFKRAADLGLAGMQKLQYVDLHSMLLDNLLMKADKLSMAHSLEVRVPFLDRRLVELGLALPLRAKAGLRRSKALLREILRADLPRAITQRPKRGFEIPVNAWFREPSTSALRQRIVSGLLVTTLGLRAGALAKLVQRHLAGEDLGRQLFSLAALDGWLQRYS